MFMRIEYSRYFTHMEYTEYEYAKRVHWICLCMESILCMFIYIYSILGMFKHIEYSVYVYV